MGKRAVPEQSDSDTLIQDTVAAFGPSNGSCYWLIG
jgi:hypothetical protein